MGITYDHVVLRTSDLPRAIAFYRDVLGLEHSSTGTQVDGTRQAAFHVGDRIFLVFHRPEFTPADPGKEDGMDHLSFTMDAESYEKLLQRLREHGVRYAGPVPNRGALGRGAATYFYDPDMNMLEVKAYEPEIMAKYNVEDPGATGRRKFLLEK